MTHKDLAVIRHKPPRVRWFLVAGVFFTLGMVAATSLFAYSSRIPIPLKDAPTRSDRGEMKIKQPLVTESTVIAYPETLKKQGLGSGKAPLRETAPALASPAPKLAYYVRAGSFKLVEGADNRVSELSKDLSSFDARVEVRPAPGGTSGQPFYWVLVGPFGTSGGADEVRAHLALLGMDTRLERLPVEAVRQ